MNEIYFSFFPKIDQKLYIINPIVLNLYHLSDFVNTHRAIRTHKIDILGRMEGVLTLILYLFSSKSFKFIIFSPAFGRPSTFYQV